MYPQIMANDNTPNVEMNYTITETRDRILSLEAKHLVLQNKYKKLKSRVKDYEKLSPNYRGIGLNIIEATEQLSSTNSNYKKSNYQHVMKRFTEATEQVSSTISNYENIEYQRI